MKTSKYLLSVALSLTVFSAFAQQNPAALNPLINKTPLTGVGDEFDFSVSIGNNGALSISGADGNNVMRFDLTLGKSKPKVASGISTLGTDAISGTVLDFFTVTYDQALNTFTGIQKANVPLPPVSMKQLVVHAVVTTESSNPQAAQIGASVDITPNVTSIGTQSETDDEVGFFTYTVSILPVSSIKLTTVINADKAILEWETVAETNTSYFQIEKSTDGINFSPIGKVSAAGNVSSVSHYTFTDPQFSTTSYYRIRLYDKDGKTRLSNIGALEKNISIGINIFPNPAKTFVIVSGVKAKQIIQFCDYKGATLQQIKVAGNTNYINLDGYSSGAYIIRVFDQGRIISSNKFIKY